MIDVRERNRAFEVRVPAKINLTLRVLGRRPDGFHELESVVVAVDLADTLRFHPAATLSLEVSGREVPPGEDNLVLRAARALAKLVHETRGARIELEKRIPPGLGLGGGSADAAAALAGLDALWGCGLATEALAALGAEIGSDVPLFFSTPVAVMRGRGERIQPTDAACRWWAALAWPDYGHPTAEVYAAYDGLEPASDGPPATAILAALGGSAAEAVPLLVNDLEPAARKVQKSQVDFRRIFREAGARAVGMTGSGSAWFALADTAADARRWADAARTTGAESLVVQLARRTKAQQEIPPCRSPTSP